MRTSGLVLQLRTCCQAYYYLTDHILLYLFALQTPQLCSFFGYYNKNKCHTSPNHTLLAKLKAKVQLIDKLACSLCVQLTPFNIFSQKPQDFTGSFSQPIWQFDTRLTYYKLLVVHMCMHSVEHKWLLYYMQYTCVHI